MLSKTQDLHYDYEMKLILPADNVIAFKGCALLSKMLGVCKAAAIFEQANVQDSARTE